jgi:hypothetical protein
MTEFSDAFASALPSITTVFGEAATVTDPDATATSATAYFGNPSILDHVEYRAIVVPTSDVTTIKRGYTITRTADSRVYTLDSATERNGTWVCDGHAPNVYKDPSLGVLG